MIDENVTAEETEGKTGFTKRLMYRAFLVGDLVFFLLCVGGLLFFTAVKMEGHFQAKDGNWVIGCGVGAIISYLVMEVDSYRNDPGGHSWGDGGFM